AWAAGDGAIATPGLYGNYIDNSSINYGEYLAKFFTENNMRIDKEEHEPPQIQSVNIIANQDNGEISVIAAVSDDDTVDSAVLTLKDSSGAIIESINAELILNEGIDCALIDEGAPDCGAGDVYDEGEEECGSDICYQGSVIINEVFSSVAGGIYTVEIVVTDNKGLTDTEIKTVTVEPENVLPYFQELNVSVVHEDGIIKVTGTAIEVDGSVESVDIILKSKEGEVIEKIVAYGVQEEILIFSDNINDEGIGYELEPVEFSAVFENIAPGEYSIEATVTDDNGATATKTKTVKVDGNSEKIPPVIEKLEVTVDSETGLVEVTGTAIDNNGERGGYVDAISLTLKSSGGDIIKQVDTLPAVICTTAEPGVCYYETADFSENFENVPNGSYSIEAIVTDEDGLTGSAIKYFSVGEQIDTVDVEVKAVDTDTVFVEDDTVFHAFNISNNGSVDAHGVEVIVDIENGTLVAEQVAGCNRITSTKLKCTIDQLPYDAPKILKVAIIVDDIDGDGNYLRSTATVTALEPDLNSDNNSDSTANPIQDEPGTEGIKEEPKDGLGGSLGLFIGLIAVFGFVNQRRRIK
ncbi:MAG: hypothetical protein D6B27_00540, partial [Gammaproteobacteria bacterium]